MFDFLFYFYSKYSQNNADSNGMDLTRLYFFHRPDFTACSRRWFLFKQHIVLVERPPSPLLGLFWSTHRNSASRVFFSERRPAAVTDDESPIIAAHTRKPIGAVPGRRMGLFRNNTIMY
ncbi:hypothetical protein Zmor_006461 [Zophobas morio]|uniref:Uncharacterized protein n=1 Tax=Zophobas morio TaxID=2755281 RepID=A0AA38ISD3_9CUCU|nr:hypothetical protein Zmor_006461 [Zophobas morio]